MLRRMMTLTMKSPRTKPLAPRIQRQLKSTKTLSTVTDDSNNSQLILKSWKKPVVESHGDYREEAWLEDHVGGPLYQHQQNLPRLPVPKIEDTLQRFLPTALPLCRTAEEEVSLKQAVASFAAQSEILQERLLQRQRDTTDSSWLQHWWNTLMYLQFRESVVINVSYFFHFADDPSTRSNVERGAAILTAVADYRNQVASGSLPAETVGKKKTTLCSTAYKYMFHACRIPQESQDAYRIYDPVQHFHAVVARKGHFFAIPLVNELGETVPLQQLQDSLSDCISLADRLPDTLKLGYLTSSHRDDWAHARAVLLEEGGPAMLQALELLESGAVLLCLDDETPVSRSEMAELLLHGGLNSGYNRWFDKSVQLIVTENGKAGLLGEHSMMDGMPVVGLANRITEMTYKKCQKASSATSSNMPSTVTPIFADVLQEGPSSETEELVEKAKNDFEDWILRHQLRVQSFQGYGSDFMKKAGFSPDAYVQMAMQLATYRLWGEQGGTYEATQVRPFLHGRTETTRSVSPQSAAFVKKLGLYPKMDEHDPDIRKEKIQLLQDAVDAHVKFIGLAAQAQGVDRHFLGLSLLVQDGEAMPDLYSHPVFARSKRWRVSTSHLTHPKFDGWGYGEVFPDGVGLAYSIHKRHCVFNITALREHDWTDKLSQLLEEALLEMRTLIEMDQPPISKL